MSAPSVVDFYSPPHTGLAFGVVNSSHKNGHSGQDYNQWKAGTLIPSPFVGKVVRRVIDGASGNVNDLGNYVTVEIPGVGWFTVCHLRDFVGAPSIGQRIDVGQALGPLGNTGYSKGNHVHTMLSTTSSNPNSRAGIVDPKPYIDAVRNALLGGDLTPFTSGATMTIYFQYQGKLPEGAPRVVAVEPALGICRYPSYWEVAAIENEVTAGRAKFNPLAEPEWTQTIGPLMQIEEPQKFWPPRSGGAPGPLTVTLKGEAVPA